MRRIVSCLVWLVASLPAAAFWSATELHLQFGRLETPAFAGGRDLDTFTATLQHANSWAWGDNFFFLDAAVPEGGSFSDPDIYGEWYSSISLRKVAGKQPWEGPVRDFRFMLGFNWDPDVDVLKVLPGVSISWNAKGFAFLNTDLTFYVDRSRGVLKGGAPREGDSFMIDVNWARPIGKKFSIEGHAEYIGERTNELGQKVEAWILAQPQFRYWVTPKLALGIEYQYWMNKLGDGATDESAVQALAVWKF